MIGLDQWIKPNFEKIDSDIKNEFNWTVVTPFFVDYSSIHTKIYVNNFIKKYKLDPSNIGLLGFDVGEYFSYQLFNYGVNFLSVSNSRSDYKFKEYCISIQLSQMGEGNGYENVGLHLLQYFDYELLKIR